MIYMKKEDLKIEGTIPKSREIYFYVIMGHFYYWLNQIRYKTLKINSKNHAKTIILQVDIIERKAGGEVKKNFELIKHVSENHFTEKVMKTAEKGIPLVTIGSGSPPRVMITAGVHGNELAPQLAALNLINDLQDHKIRGTVYIVPFVAPEATAENSKDFKGNNLNLTSNVLGNPSNLVFETAKKKKIDSLADFHTTSTDPAKTCVIYYPTINSSKIAVYIHKKAASPLLALKQHPGMLVTLCNSNGIPSIICEVESADGEASVRSINESYNQMMAFLNYHDIII